MKIYCLPFFILWVYQVLSNKEVSISEAMSCFHPHKKHGEMVQENAENKRKRLLFLRHCKRAGNIQVKDGKKGISNGYGENLLKMREKYERK